MPQAASRQLWQALHFLGQAVPDELQQADEIFLSNAIRGIRWVGRIGDKTYASQQTVDIFNQAVRTLLH